MEGYLYPQHLELDNNADGSHLAPGFRFHPTDEELITYYLLKKVLDSSFSGRPIAEVDLNKCEPWELPEKAKKGEEEWYFFSLRDRKYPTGMRTNRATEAGYWKGTGKDRGIYSSKTSSLVGMKKTLVFYCGRPPKGVKSNWVMHEYRLDGKFAYDYIFRSPRDEWVISRVFHKPGTGLVSGLACGGALYGVGGRKPLISASSASLPPLLDSSPYPALTDGCDSSIPKEHVSFFSTISSSVAFDWSNPGVGGLFQLGPPTPGLPRHGDANNFPSLRSLQVAGFFLPPLPGIGLGELGGCSSSGYLAGQDDHKLEGAGSSIV